MKQLSIVLATLIGLLAPFHAKTRAVSAPAFVSGALPEITEAYPIKRSDYSRAYRVVRVVRTVPHRAMPSLTIAQLRALANVRLVAPLALQSTGGVRSVPELPRIFLETTINSTTIPNLFLTQETPSPSCSSGTKTCLVTVCASGCNHTSTSAAFGAISTDDPSGESEIIRVTAGYTSDSLGDNQSINYTTCLSGANAIWLQSSAIGSLPQETEVSPSETADMFNLNGTETSNFADVLLNINPGSCKLIISGMYLSTTGATGYGTPIQIGNAAISTAVASTGSTSSSGSGSAWSNPSNAFSTSLFATLSTSSLPAQTLTVSNLGLAVPSGATITGVQVAFKADTSAGSVALTVAPAGLSGSGSISPNITSTLTAYSSGSAMWGSASITPAQVNSSGFGFTFNLASTDSGATLSLDTVAVTVFYTDYPYDIMIDRSVILPGATTYTHEGIANYGAAVAVVDSYIGNVYAPGNCSPYSDDQDIETNGPGPYKYVNVFMGGFPSENFMFGGITLPVNGVLSADVEIRKTQEWNNPALITASFVPEAKNLQEFKQGIRILDEGNILGYSQDSYVACGGQQYGYAVDFNSQNQTPPGTSTLVQDADITFAYNVIQHVGAGFSFDARPFSATGGFETNQRIWIHDVLMQDLNFWQYGTGPQTATTAGTISGTTETLTLANTASFITGGKLTVFGFTGGDSQFNTVHTIGSAAGVSYTLSGSQVSFSCAAWSCSTATAVGNGTVAAVVNASPGIFSISGSEANPDGAIEPGPDYLNFSNNAGYGSTSSAGNGNYIIYILKPNHPCGANFPGTRLVDWTFQKNIFVVDATTLNGDASCNFGSGSSSWSASGVIPGVTIGGNLLFNVTSSSTYWGTFTPGTFLTGLASSPSTINTNLGIANYATCAAGDTSPTNLASLSSCVITGTYATGYGPNISAIIAAQSVPNDSTQWGPRKMWPWQ